MSAVRALEVRIQGQLLGHLVAASGRVGLRVSQSWRRRVDRFVLSMSLEDTGLADIPARSGLPPYFDNLLPEGDLRAWILQSEGLRDDGMELLSRLGHDLLGAVTLAAVDESIELDQAQDDAPPRQPPADGRLHWSLAGVQLKLNLVQRGASLTLPVRGELGSFIAKLPDRRFTGVPETEHATMSWARAAGLETAETRLIDAAKLGDFPSGMAIGDEPVLLVTRFDRMSDGATRVHCEEFTQALGRRTDQKYSGNGWALQLKLVQLACPEDIAEYLRRLLFVVLSGNTDAHHKNLALRYADGRRPRLAPGYDQVAAVRWTMLSGELKDQLPFKLGHSRRFEQLHLASIIALLDRVGVNSFQDRDRLVERAQTLVWLREQARTIMDHRRVAEVLGGDGLAAALNRHHARLPLVAEL